MEKDTTFESFGEENIFEPLAAYKNIFKEKFNRNAQEYFDGLVEKSKIDIEANKETNRKIKKAVAEAEQLDKKIITKSGWRLFLIFLAVVSFIAFIGGIIITVQGIQDTWVPILTITLGLVIAIFSLIMIFVAINPKIKALQLQKNEEDKRIKKLKNEAWEQLKSLNDLFGNSTNIDLFKKTIPLINLDQTFNSKRLDYLVNKFGLADNYDLNRSTLYVQSGDIIGNPFFLARDLVHYLGTKTYSGSITITWTTTTYINGKASVRHHSQVLTAHVTKPCPYYHKETYLVYGNEAAPDLIFSREDSDAELLNEKQIQKVVAKEEKKLNKMAEKSLKKGGTFTVMGNTEFDVLWGGQNRNNEVQFRLLFTPLAQKQLLALMKDKTVAYGDDFDFIKHKKINIVEPEHLATTIFELGPEHYRNYDYEEMRKNFLFLNNDFFKSVYFTFAPILAIPIYQQHKPHEYIYKDLYESYVSFYEHEKVANALNEDEFKHPLCKTPSILKTSTIRSGDFLDTVLVTAYGYKTIERVEVVRVSGGDGRIHTVPVSWTEYIPVQKETPLNIGIIEEQKAETWSEKIRKSFEAFKKDDSNEGNKDIIPVGLFLAHIVKSKKKDK
ncbi:MAG: hypothetical protein WDA35_01800 [Bacilli bacterium]